MRPVRAILLGALLAGCTLAGRVDAPPTGTPTLPAPEVTTQHAPDPADVVQSFLQAWGEGDYAAMYAGLSQAARAATTPEAFIERYQDFDQQAAIQSVQVEFLSSNLSPREAVVQMGVELDSAIVGAIRREVSFGLIREGENWGIDWNDGLILPELAGGNGVYMDLATPARGEILDRNGAPLASLQDVAALWIVPNQVGDEGAESSMLSALQRLLGIRGESIQARYDDIRQFDWRVPLGEVTLTALQNVQGTLASTGGVQWGTYTGRYYPDNGLAPHVVGYVAQLQAEQLEEYLRMGYPRDAFIGQTGVEAGFESALRGAPGGTLYAADSEGRVGEAIVSRASTPASTVYLNIDSDLQRNVEQAISEFTGAAVVLERDTGEVLAMASSPTFDPNAFDWRNPNSSDSLTALFNSTEQPLVNRAASGTYPLGSVFKIITTAAALESGLYRPDTIYDCGSEFRELQGRVLLDWTVEKELPPQGNITLLQAFERSCNPYFYHIGLDLFRQGHTTALTDMATAFGLGAPTGIEIAEAGGLVPGPETKAERSDEPWRDEDSVFLAIGQSFLQVTPLQVARFVAAVGNGGTLYRPQVVARVVGPDGQVEEEFTPEAQARLPISDDTLSTLQQAMVRVIREPKGTAQLRFRGLNLKIAGKTGTAQTGEFTPPNAWFVGYTFEGREERPDIAVAVILEFQGEGSEWAAPVVRRIIESYFYGRPIALYPWESDYGVRREPTPTPEPGDAGGEATPSP